MALLTRRRGVPCTCLALLLLLALASAPWSCHGRSSSSSSEEVASAARESVILLTPATAGSKDWLSLAWQSLTGTSSAQKQQQIRARKLAASSRDGISIVTMDRGQDMNGLRPPAPQDADTTTMGPMGSTLGSSKIAIVDNIAPSYVPSARLVVPIADLGDGAHWGVKVLLGKSNKTGADLPDSSSLTVTLVLDTGSSDLFLFNRTTCAGSTTACPNSVTTQSFVPGGNALSLALFSIEVDGEAYKSGTGGTGVNGGTLGTDLVTMSATVLGTKQVEYLVEDLHMQITDGTIVAIPANIVNANAADYNSYALVDSYYYDKADGVLGLTFPARSGVAASFRDTQSAFQILINQADPFFSLDFSGGQLVLGGISEQYRSQLVWSNGPVTAILPDYHSFRLYHLTICGVDMFQNITSSWHALIDTGSSCLGLPAEFYDMLISWLPIHCNLGRMDGLPQVCYLHTDVRSVLPTLSFRLADAGTELQIDLATLLFTQGTLNRLCIYRMDSIIGGATTSNPIVFGGRVLKQFFAAFDMTSSPKIGLAMKVPLATASRVQCAARVQCTGMEVHYDPLNMCLPPPCSDYYFFDLDKDTKSCKLSLGFHILCGIVIGIFILAELGLNEMVIFLSGKVQQNGIVAG